MERVFKDAYFLLIDYLFFACLCNAHNPAIFLNLSFGLRALISGRPIDAFTKSAYSFGPRFLCAFSALDVFCSTVLFIVWFCLLCITWVTACTSVSTDWGDSVFFIYSEIMQFSRLTLATLSKIKKVVYR